MIRMYIGPHVKYPLLSDCNENLIFSTDFRKILKYQLSWKSVPWEPSCSLRTDGQIRYNEDDRLFCNFAKAPKNSQIII